MPCFCFISLGFLLITWFTRKQEMDIWLHPLFFVWYGYLHIPELHRRFISTATGAITLINYDINFKIKSVSNYLPMHWYLFLDSKVHVAKMGPTWVLSAPGGPHAGPVNLAIRVAISLWKDLIPWRTRLHAWRSSLGRMTNYMARAPFCISPSWYNFLMCEGEYCTSN